MNRTGIRVSIKIPFHKIDHNSILAFKLFTEIITETDYKSLSNANASKCEVHT